MSKKLIICAIIAIFTLSIFSFVYATDVIIDLDSNNTTASSNDENSILSIDNTNVDNTIYTSTPTDNQSVEDTQEPAVTTTTTSYDEDSNELSVTNIINIILIVVGVVLVLLGIAIITRLK